LLRHIPDKPTILHIKGEAKFDYEKMLSVVGTRNATYYGIEQTKKIIDEIPAETCIVSGLALGIDTQAHLSALENKLPTIAVLGHGLDIIYPASNKELAEKILDNGGTLISEMPFGTPILAGIFPRRNRIIAGITHATLVVEASVKGGALITAAFANGYNRTVFAIAGRNDSCFSQGCNSLIKQNSAMLVDSGSDIFEAMNWKTSITRDAEKTDKTGNLLEKEVQILQIIEREKPCSLDTIFEKTNLPVPEILSILTKLEISNFIKETSTCLYEPAIKRH
jgi:DNA processing protein